MTTNNTFSNQNREENNTFSNLTEQWKKGELDEGFYYLKDNQYIFIDYFNGVSFEETCDFEIKEVLAEVPDYLIWKNYVNGYCEEHKYNLQLIEENQKLKELLIKAKGVLSVYRISKNQSTYSDKDILGLLTKIDEVLK